MWFSTFCFLCCCFGYLSLCNSFSYIQIFWQLFPPFIVLALRLQSALVLCVLFAGSLWSHCCFTVRKCHSSCPDVFISVVIIAKVL